MADISTEELEKIEKEFHSDTGSIRTMKEFVSPEELFDELIKSIHRYHPSADTSLVEKAYKVAYDAHNGQVRKSGEAYIIHPLCVAKTHPLLWCIQWTCATAPPKENVV